MTSALVSAALEGGYLASARLARVHWQAADRALAPPRVVALIAGVGIGAAGHTTGISQASYNTSQAQVTSLKDQVSSLKMQVVTDNTALATAQTKAATAQQTANSNAAAAYKELISFRPESTSRAPAVIHGRVVDLEVMPGGRRAWTMARCRAGSAAWWPFCRCGAFGAVSGGWCAGGGGVAGADGAGTPG